jgi:hypothetical protein
MEGRVQVARLVDFSGYDAWSPVAGALGGWGLGGGRWAVGKRTSASPFRGWGRVSHRDGGETHRWLPGPEGECALSHLSGGKVSSRGLWRARVCVFPRGRGDGRRAAAVVWVAGVRLAEYAEEVADRTGLGQAFLGAETPEDETARPYGYCGTPGARAAERQPGRNVAREGACIDGSAMVTTMAAATCWAIDSVVV